MTMLPHDPVRQAEGLVVFGAVHAATLAVDKPRVEDHVIARRDARDGTPHRLHDAGAIGADHPPRLNRDARDATQHPEIEAIQRGRFHADPHLIGAVTHRHREVVTNTKLVEPAVGINGERAHRP